MRLLAPRGLVVIDDITPEEHWPEAWQGRRDPVRDFWLHNLELLGTEVRTTAETAVTIARTRT